MKHDYLMHYGTKRHSGRYDWGSGETPYQHEPWFEGWGKLSPKEQSEYAKSFGMTLKEARARYGIAKSMEKYAKIHHAQELRYTKQMSVKAIAEKMGVSESTVDSWLKPNADEKVAEIKSISEELEKFAQKHAAVDIGKGCANAMGVNPTKLEYAVQLLVDKGYYKVYWDQLQQTNVKGEKTHMMALTKPKPEWENMTEAEIKKDAYKTVVVDGLDDIPLPFEIKFNEDIGKAVSGFDIPKSISSKKIEVIYTDKATGTGGVERDGLIEVRRGAEGLDLGGNYAQVRIGVDDTHYIKGMAVYSDNLPEGIDIRVHSKKSPGTPLKGKGDDTVLKPMKTDADGKVDFEDPFGAQITAQSGYINKVTEEGKWGDWTSNETLASQVLSKQDPSLAKRQLDLFYSRQMEQYDDIMKIENPVIRQKKLEDFADECDKAAVHLKAAAMPGQTVKVLLPVVSLKPGECYCPGYKDGDKLALVRYPHGSTAEMPILTVNNHNKEAAGFIPNDALDCIGLNPKDAQRMSGADFDGDTVVCIPNNKGWIKNQPEFKGLKGFDTNDWVIPKDENGNDIIPNVKHDTQQIEMGKITNLITDMTLAGATEEEFVRAIKYSMVVIDSEKHHLDYKGAREEYRIDELKLKYRGDVRKGASTIISKASGEKDVNEKKKYYKVDPNTGEKIIEETGNVKIYYTNPNTGKKYYKIVKPNDPDYDPNAEHVTQKSTQMAEAKDAYELVSKDRYPMEIVYADHANRMKALGNKARLESLRVEDVPYNAEAAKVYAKEVQSLKDKVDNAHVNAAIERLVSRSAAVIINDRIKKYPERYNRKTAEGKKNLGKLRNQTIRRQRALYNKEKPFDITDREWDAICAGALRKSDVKEIVNRADADRLKELYAPKKTKLTALSASNVASARAMLNSGYTQAQVAEFYNVSPSTLRKLLAE